MNVAGERNVEVKGMDLDDCSIWCLITWFLIAAILRESNRAELPEFLLNRNLFAMIEQGDCKEAYKSEQGMFSADFIINPWCGRGRQVYLYPSTQVILLYMV